MTQAEEIEALKRDVASIRIVLDAHVDLLEHLARLQDKTADILVSHAARFLAASEAG